MESAYKLRQELITNNNIHSIINILGETFKTVGVESCILLFSKSKPDQTIKFLSTSKDQIDDKEFNFVNRDNWMANRNFLFDISSSNVESMIINKIKLNSLALNKSMMLELDCKHMKKIKDYPNKVLRMLKIIYSIIILNSTKILFHT
ncbi:MAG: N-6 DNA methylase [Ignavibacteria bacterium]|nr:N-6 DNA methylase [Ignavibacteria bacterium]